MITITAFRRVPRFAQGQVRDLRLRWALEEAGIPYRTRLIGPAEQRSDAYRVEQPFGQVPVMEEDGRTLFESGACVLEIARRDERLLPADPERRARTIQWMFAALNSVEPPLMNVAEVDVFLRDEAMQEQRRPIVMEQARKRLAELARALGERSYLVADFTAADILMSTVLRIANHTDLVANETALAAYHARCEARPAFRRALAGQLSDLGVSPITDPSVA